MDATLHGANAAIVAETIDAFGSANVANLNAMGMLWGMRLAARFIL